jgi:hypothetical protein
VGSRAGMDTEVIGLRVLDSLPPFPQRSKQYLEPGRAVGHIKQVYNTSTSQKSETNIFKHVITFFVLTYSVALQFL